MTNDRPSSELKMGSSLAQKILSMYDTLFIRKAHHKNLKILTIDF